jgi:predicted MPP superfamily phosphohydrolase
VRRFIGALGGLGLGIGAAALAYATRIEPRWLEIGEIDLSLPRLPRALDGLTVLHLSDFHTKPGRPWHRDLIERAAAVPADLVCMTGDYGDRPQWAPIAFEALRKARGRLGTFAVLGNHDLDSRPLGSRWPHRFSTAVGRRLASQLEAEGVTVLDNESARVCVAGAPLWVVGVSDPHTFHDDAWRAYEGVPADEPSIFLAHAWQPTVVATERGALLALAGHTHGGQVRPPFLPAPVHNSHRKPPRNGGLSWVGDTALHISHGLGGTYDLRFLVRPRAVRLTLRER